jgi:1-acyl-sn-glycerol-3-phosphate acyltransferase
LGGYPVERNKRQDMVDQVADIIKSHDTFILAVAPEGTRQKVDRLRTGFYYIAKAAGIPVIPVGFDFGGKAVVIGDPIWPTTIERDMPTLISFFANVQGRNPELGIRMS